MFSTHNGVQPVVFVSSLFRSTCLLCIAGGQDLKLLETYCIETYSQFDISWGLLAGLYKR
jgi:hypothetical protein